ncbi:hypothetical protein SLE2022_279060 [Rubroshorea leprosula]
MYDRIPSRFNLLKRGVLQDFNGIKCEMCGSDIEDTHHLLLHCKNSSELWANCWKWWGIASLLLYHCTMAYEQHSHSLTTRNCQRMGRGMGSWHMVIVVNKE